VEAGGFAVQSTQQRDLAALALVVGLFVVLCVVTLFVGPTAR
jgi:predicted membrane protein